MLQQAELASSVERDIKLSGAQQHKRLTASLHKQIQQQQTKLQQVRTSPTQARSHEGHGGALPPL